MERFDVLSIGEALIDMTPQDGAFLPKVGGAPLNTAVAAKRLGLKSAVCARVGKDAFGEQIAAVIREQGVSDSLLQFDRTRGTTLAFVHLDSHGDRSFSFYRHGLADTALALEPDCVEAAKNARCVHFGSVALAEEPERSTVLELAKAAREAGAMVSYDPNLRFPLWKGREAELKEEALAAAEYATVMKVSDDEAEWLLGISDPAAAVAEMRARYGLRAAFVTCGAKGAFGAFECGTFFEPAPDVKVVDTTGAGDCFIGAALVKLLTVDEIDAEKARDILRFASREASDATTRKGAF